ncbi:MULTISPECIES: GNAT family N-acetyltransferase [Duncaniella]|uniref:GNAT family N-acetyltransferase n=1 Tax=Duncaniella dubosii TaxID=2518971 RepID=A0A4P7W575_9BACT|nr:MULTISPECIES: GNAT family N-acetyltransferase [Duncaniella]MCX4284781.1 GNAT family N-acetyltransferase [Duncaniella dubosii]QCD42670.1 GNAT family N-acetyltransferase [Duncaniella dubosii]HBI58186.1 zinc ABC transporter permease [Porphyromonadaceae bacterium]HBN63603.1 zinc ABC transporter permease [Porphyromonadaceae bacterium]
MKIVEARKEDAPLIARSIMDAVGEEICLGLAGRNHTLEDVKGLFTRLAEREDTQYSYLNTLVAVDDDGKTVGVCVGYDGAKLDELRKPFFEAVRRELGKDMGDVEDETDSSEFYLDTLAVLPAYRGRGIASQLLEASVRRAASTGKPAGLLVDKDNLKARRLYEKVGFTQVGERPFCYVMMDHLQYRGK